MSDDTFPDDTVPFTTVGDDRGAARPDGPVRFQVPAARRLHRGACFTVAGPSHGGQRAAGGGAARTTEDAMGRLESKVALITGSGTGIGAAMAALFASEGAHVVVSGDREPSVAATAARIAQAGGSVESLVLDVTDENAVADAVRGVVSRRGRLDILVNNAFRMSAAPIAEMGTAAWKDSFAVALDAVFYATRAALPLMAAAGGGAILNISSTAGHAGLHALAGYSSAKAALEAFTRVAAVEGAAGGVRVNALAPGCIATPGTLSAFPTEAARRAMHRLIPLARFGDPVEVAKAALFLVSDDASFVTGTCLVVDGGQRAYLGAPAIEEGFVHGSAAEAPAIKD